MPAMIGLGIASLVGGFAGKKSAKKDRRQQMQILQEDLAFKKQRYTNFKALYGDLEKQLVEDAKTGVKADIKGVTDRAVGDVAQQFSGAEQQAVRNDQRYGINPNSGRAEASSRALGIAKATTTAGLVNQQRETEQRRATDLTWNRRAAVNNLGVSQMNNAAAGVSAGLGGIADAYGSSASDKAAEASQLFGAAGTMIGMGIGKSAGGTGASDPYNAQGNWKNPKIQQQDLGVTSALRQPDAMGIAA